MHARQELLGQGIFPVPKVLNNNNYYFLALINHLNMYSEVYYVLLFNSSNNHSLVNKCGGEDGEGIQFSHVVFMPPPAGGQGLKTGSCIHGLFSCVL